MECWQAIAFGFWISRNNCAQTLVCQTQTTSIVCWDVHSCNLLVPDFVGWFKRCARQDCMLYMYWPSCDVCVYLYVMDLNLEYGYNMCYMFSHCIYFFCIFILSSWTICRYKYIDYWMVCQYCLVTEHLSLKISNGLSVAICIQGNRMPVGKSTICR
jgi:hypothetical protein